MPGMTKAGYTPEISPKPPKAVKPDTPKKKTPKKKKKKKRINRAAIASLVIFVAAFAIGTGTLHIFSQVERYQNAFSLGLMLNGHPIGGMSAEEGAAMLDEMTEKNVVPWQYQIECQGRSYTLTAADVGLFIDKQATLEPLWQVGKTGSLLESYMEMLKTQAMRVNGLPVLGYAMDPVDAMLEQIKLDTDCASVDATVSYTPQNSEPFRFTDEVTGYALDTTALRGDIEQAILTLTPGSTVLKPVELKPTVTRAQLEAAISLRARIVMALDDDEASMTNVRIAAQMLNGVRLEAGDTLSFNEVIGKRTKEGGYVSAPEPAYGVGVSGTGGGVCQVSTALYRAALLGGLPVVSRSAAVRPVAYCEMGQEAAVSDTGLDLVIENPTDAPLFATARIYESGEDQMLEIQLIGEPLGVKYALVSSPLETDMTSEPVYMEDKTGAYAVYRDQRVQVSEAQPGYSVVVERATLGENGEAVSTEVVSEDLYEAIGPIIYVGTQGR